MLFQIRPATLEDASEIARLSGQLGYPGTPSDIEDRLRLLKGENYATLVAAGSSGLLGWIAAEKRITLGSGIRYEIVGLVVDETARRAGAGRELVRAIRDWAGRQSAARIYVRSSIARQESHAFYLAQGFERRKTQHVYVLELPLLEE